MDKLNALTVEDALLNINTDDRGELVADMTIRFGIDRREIVRMVVGGGLGLDRRCTMDKGAMDFYRCSMCDEYIIGWAAVYAPNYCPNCGAKVVSE